MDNSRILAIPDIHNPYGHPDYLDFLKKIKALLNPTRVILGGDEVDFHSYSMHKGNPDLLSPGHELAKAVSYIQGLYELFPDMDVLESNHTSLPFRKALEHGTPRKLLKSYNEILEVGDGWRWHDYLILTLPNGRRCKFIHSAGTNVLAASQTCGMSLLQFHYHSLFELRYWNGGDGVNFAITAGCLVDDKSLAMAYNKLHAKRPLLGVVFINDSIPQLIPMVVDENNRWIGTKI